MNKKDFSGSILDAAERLIGEVGYAKTTVADIAREMQMSPANIYRFFASRAEIDDAVCRRILEKIESSIAVIAGGSEPAGRALWNTVSILNQLNAQLAQLDNNLHQLVKTAYDENWPASRAHRRRMDQLFGQIIGRGMASGEFRSGDLETASRVFHSICLKYCYEPAAEEITPGSGPVISQIADFASPPSPIKSAQRNGQRREGKTVMTAVGRLRPDANTLQLGGFLTAVQALRANACALELRRLALLPKRKSKYFGYQVQRFTGREPCPGCNAPCQMCSDFLLCR